MNHVNKACETVKKWILRSEQEIFDTFANLPNAMIINKDLPFDYRSIYIKGTREDSVILCAHLDTVWNDGLKEENIETNGEIIYSTKRNKGYNDKNGYPYSNGIGIGADDRAGIAMLWELKDSGHSLLITCGEESGCLGACSLAADDKLLQEISDENQFFIALDRRLYHQLVFYNVATEEFIEYAVDQTGFSSEPGGGSDICVLCKYICGVNISVGYKNEHGHNEIFVASWWLDTLNTLYIWLSEENIPRFDFVNSTYDHYEEEEDDEIQDYEIPDNMHPGIATLIDER